MKHSIPAVSAAAFLCLVTAATAGAQAPLITQQGDPSVKADSIYKLAVKPEDHPEETAAYLLDDGVVRLEADGTGTRTYRQIVQVLRAEAVDALREQRFSYAPNHEKFTINWIRVVKPDGTVISEKPLQVQESDVPAQLGDPTYSDRKVIRISLTGVEPGTIVDYSTTKTELKPFLPGDFLESWSISTGLAVSRSRYVVDLPASLKVRIDERNVKNPHHESMANGRRILSWTASDLPRIKAEAFAADSNDVYQGVMIGSPMTWGEIGKWYATNAKGRYTTGPSVDAKLASVLAGAKTIDDSIRAIHKWVAQDVRYVAIALGLGGYQPRVPAEVVQSGFGDCKDKATLFVTALNKIGLTAFPVLLNSDGGVRRGLPSIGQFDHAIAAFKRRGSTTYEFADLTASSTPLGELPFSEQGAFGIVVHPDGQIEEVTFPKTKVAENRHTVRVIGTLTADGLFDGSYEESGTGVHQYDLRNAFENPLDSTTRANGSNAIASKWFENAEGNGLVGFNGKDLLAPAALHLAIHHGKAASISGNTVVLKNPLGSNGAMIAAAKEIDAKSPRVFDIDPEKIFGYQETVTELRITLPDGWKAQLPPSVHATSAFGSYDSEYAQAGNVLTLRRHSAGASGVQPAKAIGALTAWFREIGKDDAGMIIIQKN